MLSKIKKNLQICECAVKSMTNIYKDILKAISEDAKLFAILLDPDKIVLKTLSDLILKINQSPAIHIFIGRSQVTTTIIGQLVVQSKQNSNVAIVLLPGRPSQISDEAKAISFLSNNQEETLII